MANEPKNPFEEEIKADEQDLALIAEEFQPDPYAYTRAVQEAATKSWRQMLIDSHKKREAERTKRLRSEQIVGIGKALGDLLGAAFAGAGSTKGDYAAIVPQAQAPKSVERIHSLINEGIVNAKDYDNMMFNLAMQKGKEDIALAKAYDDLHLRQRQIAAQQKFAEGQAKEQRDFQAAEAQKQRDFTAARDEKKREHAAAVKAIKETATKDPKSNKKFTDGDIAILAAISASFPEYVNKESEVTDPLTNTTKTIKSKVPFVGDEQTWETYLLQENGKMLRFGLNPNSEEDKLIWSQYLIHKDTLDKLASEDKIKKALKEGYTVQEIIEFFSRK